MAGNRTTIFERQWNEVEALKSIYLDEFEELPFPWKVDHPPSFILHLSNTVDENPAAADITFKLPPTYPEIPPEMTVNKRRGLQSHQCVDLLEKLTEKAKSLLGNEMIFDLAEFAKGLLGQFARKKVSFHDEMTQRKQQQSAPTTKKTEIQNGEEQARLIRQIENELNLKEKLLKTETTSAVDGIDGSLPTVLEFAPPLIIDVPYAEEALIIDTIEVGERLNLVPDELPFTGAEIFEGSAGELKLYICRISFEGTFYESAHGTKKLTAFCEKLATIKMTFNPSYSRIFGGKILRATETNLWLIMEPWNGVKLGSYLQVSGRMSFARAVSWIKQLLQATSILHLANVPHQDLNLENIFVTPGKTISLLNYLLSRFLRETHQINPISAGFSLEKEWAWRPPEMMSRKSSLSKKADIWAIGYIFIQLLFGVNFPDRFEDASECISHLRSNELLPIPILGLLDLLLASLPHERPDAQELLGHIAFSQPNISSYDDVTSSSISERPKTTRDTSTSHLVPTGAFGREIPGRYQTDFEEIQFLGKGAFGEVIKVKNRIDGRFYAIKRIHLDSNDVENNRKILREVTLLSRLHHERIVRYYQAWIEGSVVKKKASDRAINPNDETSFSEDESNRESDSDFDATLGVSGRKLFSSKLVGSTVGLSSLVQFHTGFTSSEGELEREAFSSETTNKIEKVEQQTLYIQMEYCPNQTLRDIIDAGIDENEAWRLFRQITEGLVYLHSQGMIHRDLKPGNIFIDTNGDIKIGDFGLAVGNEHDQGRSRTPVDTSLQGSPNDSLTGGVGTPLYVSPEQENQKISQRYDQKVDMYSLGIILLELLVHFETAMERMIVIGEARSRALKLPSSLLGNAAKILSNLLSHEPSRRLSADELLKSGLLPAKLEAEYVSEAIRAVANPSGAYYEKLVKTLFSLPDDDNSIDFTFDYNARTSFNMETIRQIDDIFNSVHYHCKMHGAILFPSPLLLPNMNSTPLNAQAKYFGKDGHLVCLPSEPTTPWARFAAQNSLGDIRRFFMGMVFEENPAGGQPKHSLSASLEMIGAADDRLQLFLESVQIALDSLKNLGGGNLIVKLNHSKILEAVLTHCLVPAGQIPQLMDSLAQYSSNSWVKIKSDLSESGLTQSSIAALGKIANMKEMEVNTTLKKLEEILRTSKDLSAHFQLLHTIVEAIRQIELDCELCFDPLFSQNPRIWSGVVFGIFMEDRKRAVALVHGGEFTDLILQHKLPFDTSYRPSSSGAVWNIPKLLITYKKMTKLSNHAPVLVYSSGVNMLGEKLQVVSCLWRAGIRAIVVSEDSVSNEYINQMCRSRDITTLVYLKDTISRGRFATVKVKNLEKRTEEEISRVDLPKMLLSLEDSNGPPKNVSDFIPQVSPMNVSLFSPFGKVKGAQRSMIMEMTVKSLAPVLTSLIGPKPVEVISHDIPRPLVHFVVCGLQENEEYVRKVVEDKEEREIASKLRSLLKSLKDTNQLALLYNYREKFIDLAVLGSLPTLSRIE